MVRTGYDSVDHRPGADPAGQKVRVAGLCCSGMGSAKVTDDGSAPAMAAIAPALITSRREVIVSLPNALPSFHHPWLEGPVGRDAESLPLSVGRQDLHCVFLSRVVSVSSKQEPQRRFG